MERLPPDALEKIKDAEDKPGLEVMFVDGEQLPWKGLWFAVSEVRKDELVLRPVGMTANRFHEVMGAQKRRAALAR